MPHVPPIFREPGTQNLPYGLPLGTSLQADFKEDDVANDHMNLDGSVIPRFFGVTPGSNATVAFHTFMIIIRTNTEMIFPDNFGDRAALVNGIQLAVRDADRNIIGVAPAEPIRTNGDWYWLGPEYVTYDKGFGASRGSSVAIQVRTQPAEDALVLAPGFSIGFLIRDDLTGLADMRAIAFGRTLNPGYTITP